MSYYEKYKRLKEIHEYVKDEVEAWDKRTGTKHEPPYQADAPCYYCSFVREPSIGKEACNFCIQNPDAVIFELFTEPVGVWKCMKLKSLDRYYTLGTNGDILRIRSAGTLPIEVKLEECLNHKNPIPVVNIELDFIEPSPELKVPPRKMNIFELIEWWIKN